MNLDPRRGDVNQHLVVNRICPLVKTKKAMMMMNLEVPLPEKNCLNARKRSETTEQLKQ